MSARGRKRLHQERRETPVSLTFGERAVVAVVLIAELVWVLLWVAVAVAVVGWLLKTGIEAGWIR